MAAVGPAAVRRELLILILLALLVHGIAIAVYYLAHMDHVYGRPRNIFMTVWMGAILIVVLVQLRRIRRARVAPRPPRS